MNNVGFAGLRHQLFVHLVGTEDLDAFRQFIFLAHAGPDVRVNGVRALHVGRLRRPFHAFFFRRAVVLGTNRTELQARQRTNLP